MAEFNALVTDTHPLVFHANRNRSLSRRAAAHFEACERQEAILYVPVIVIWECCLLTRAGRIDLGSPPQLFFEELFTNPAYQPIELTPEQIYLAHTIRPNQDPFDCLIAAAARNIELPLLTRDGEIDGLGLDVVW